MNPSNILFLIISLIIGIVIGYIVRQLIYTNKVSKQREEAENILNAANEISVEAFLILFYSPLTI